MTYTVARSNVKSIRPGEPHFTISSGLVVTSRASFEISNNCPAEYKSILVTAIKAGWIKPVAHVTDEEYMVMQLSN
jgi:hypothetical protein